MRDRRRSAWGGVQHAEALPCPPAFGLSGRVRCIDCRPPAVRLPGPVAGARRLGEARRPDAARPARAERVKEPNSRGNGRRREASGDAPQRPKPLTASTLQQAASALAAAVGVGNGAIAQKLHEAGEDHLHALERDGGGPGGAGGGAALADSRVRQSGRPIRRPVPRAWTHDRAPGRSGWRGCGASRSGRGGRGALRFACRRLPAWRVAGRGRSPGAWDVGADGVRRCRYAHASRPGGRSAAETSARGGAARSRSPAGARSARSTSSSTRVT